MGLGDKMNRLATNLQDGVRSTSVSVTSIIVKIITAFFFSLTLSLIAQEIMQSGTLAFVFMLVIIGALTYRILAKWSLGATLIFDLVCILVALILRMYILLAP